MRRHENGDQPQSPSSEQQANVKGIFLLLLSCRSSLLRHRADDVCAKIIDECIATFQARHNLSDHDSSEAIVWEETSVVALVRLLEYLCGELSEQLGDQDCADRLKLCIEYLTQVRHN